jgi:hypothetical protein
MTEIIFVIPSKSETNFRIQTNQKVELYSAFSVKHNCHFQALGMNCYKKGKLILFFFKDT